MRSTTASTRQTALPCSNGEAAPCALLGACGWASPTLDHLPVGVLLAQGGRTMYVNRYIVQRFGWTVDLLRYVPLWDVVADPHKA